MSKSIIVGKKKRQSSIMADDNVYEDDSITEPAAKSAELSRDDEINEPVAFMAGERAFSTMSTPLTEQKPLVQETIHPFRIEFKLGDVTKERSVDAVVNPTNSRLEPDANDTRRERSAGPWEPKTTTVYAKKL